MSDQDKQRNYSLLPLSARTPSALESMTQNLAAFFRETPRLNLADAAYTLQVGRRVFTHRRLLVCSSVPGAISRLSAPSSPGVGTHCSQEDNPRILFIFPGMPSLSMGPVSGLYRHEPFFREFLDRSFASLQPVIGFGLEDILDPVDPLAARVALLLLEVGLAELLRRWGIKPDQVIGSGIGEYAADCALGVISLAAALGAVKGQSLPVEGEEGFRRRLAALREGPKGIFLGLGPGRDLEEAWQQSAREDRADHRFMGLLPSADPSTAGEHLLWQLGQMWLHGVEIDWGAFHEDQGRGRIELPGYPFERKRYWIDMNAEAMRIKTGAPEKPDGAQENETAFFVPTWQRLDNAGEVVQGAGENPDLWVVFQQETEAAQALVNHLEKAGQRIWQVRRGPGFQEVGAMGFFLDEKAEADYDRLLDEIAAGTKAGFRILYLWGLGEEKEADRVPLTGTLARQEGSCYYALLNLCRSIGRKGIGRRVWLDVLTDNAYEAVGGDGLYPGKVLAAGAVGVIARELREINIRHIDLDLRPGPVAGDGWPALAARWADRLMAAGYYGQSEALRGHYSWRTGYQEVEAGAWGGGDSPLRPGGVYLVTGGLGALGRVFAEYLAREWRARLVLVGRRGVPAKEKWAKTVKEGGEWQEKLEWLQYLERSGYEAVVYGVDVTDKAGMEKVIREVEGKWGRINGVIHCAGQADGELIQLRKRSRSEEVLDPKVKGTMVLAELFNGRGLDLLVLCSSVAAVLPQIGQVGYTAANAFLDAFSDSAPNLGLDLGRVISIDWDRWQGTGIAQIAENQHRKLTGAGLTGGIGREDGLDAFKKVMTGHGFSRLLVANREFMGQLDRIRQGKGEAGDGDNISHLLPLFPGSEAGGERPDLDSEYVAARDGIEEKLVKIWASLFGFKDVGVKDDFFDLGGDSLKALLMLPRLHQVFQVEVPITRFFQQPTIEGLASFIAAASGRCAYAPIEAVEKRGYYPLSFIQKRLFVLFGMDEQGLAYNNFIAFRVSGEIDPVRLDRAFQALLDRHESLRTSFTLLDDEPVQKIHERVEFDIEVLRTGGRDGRSGQELVESIIKEFIRPFDLEKPPLLRVGLVKMAGNESLLLFDMHHIISDGTTMLILMRDFTQLYQGRELPPLSIQYRDFACWQHGDAGKREMEQQEMYWLARFPGEVPVLALRTDFPRPLVQSFAGQRLSFRLDGEILDRLRQLIRETGVTLYIMILAICSVLLHKHTGQEDILIGSPVAARDRLELTDLVGMFINALVLRSYPQGQKTFNRFLGEVKDDTLLALQNQGYPFGRLLEKIGTRPVFNRNPLYDFELIVQNMEVPGSGATDLQFTPIGYDTGTAQVDITLEVREMGEHDLDFRFIYCTDLFKRETIELFMTHLQEVIARVVEAPDIRLMDIRLSHELASAGPADLLEEGSGDFGF